MHLRFLDYLLWFLSCCALLAAIVAFVRRGFHRRHPYFFAYMLFELASVPVMFMLGQYSMEAYFYAYYGFMCLSVVVTVAVLYEMLKTVFPGRIRLPQPALYALVCATIAVIGTRALVLHSTSNVLLRQVLYSDRAVRLVLLLFLIAALVFGRRLRLSFRSTVFGMLLGYGLYAIVNLLLAMASGHYLPMLGSVSLSTVNSGAYLTACLVWFLYAAFGSGDCYGSATAQFSSATDEDTASEEPSQGLFLTALCGRRLTAQG